MSAVQGRDPFLGHIVSAAGICADPAKCQQVQDWPVPRDLHEVRSFVGLCSYYRRHIQGFTELAAPLYELATKGTDFELTERRHEAFGQLKNALTSAPILRFPREDGLWYLDTHASDVRTGAVLSQVQDEEERVIAYVSKSLEGSEQRNCTARKELLAVVRALKHFKCYLYGQKITVRTDNSAVSWLHRSKDPVGQPARWIEVIDTYDTVSEYVTALQGGLRAAYRHARAGLQRAALHQKHDYDGKVQRGEYQAGELEWIHDITLERTRGTKLQFPWFGPALITKMLVMRQKRDKPLAVVHVDRLEAYRGTAVPAWMTTEQRECVAV